MMDTALATSSHQQWDQLQDEPDRWFSRFRDIYLPMGPERTVAQAYRKARRTVAKVGQMVTKGDKGARGPRPSAAWYHAAQRWRWAERASQWDAHERARRLLSDAGEGSRDDDLRRWNQAPPLAKLALIASRQPAFMVAAVVLSMIPHLREAGVPERAIMDGLTSLVAEGLDALAERAAELVDHFKTGAGRSPQGVVMNEVIDFEEPVPDDDVPLTEGGA